MLKLKGCPRCRGDVVVEHDFYGKYEQCLYCGYLYDPGNVAGMKRPKNKMKEIQKCERGKVHAKFSLA
ncbi:MAG: hypothetical protein A2144_12535 [Chloroflexi bacterium RBG_16_50_9]|nr:MAG: hypothetical protein A2144_12535 [Chloroflexi bacterium RBG_16_50_9]